jgi:hypothetical protein
VRQPRSKRAARSRLLVLSVQGSASAADKTALQARMQQSADWTAARRGSSQGRSALAPSRLAPAPPFRGRAGLPTGQLRRRGSRRGGRSRKWRRAGARAIRARLLLPCRRGTQPGASGVLISFRYTQVSRGECGASETPPRQRSGSRPTAQRDTADGLWELAGAAAQRIVGKIRHWSSGFPL